MNNPMANRQLTTLRHEASASDEAVGPSALRLCALLTCFNRKALTLACLRALAASTGLDGVQLSAVLVDDASTDGTTEAVRAEFAWVTVVSGHGALFWCRGMHLAFETAMRTGYDSYLWLNDDTLLQADSVSRLLACQRALCRDPASPIIVVGSTVDAVTGKHTYGGERRPSRFRPLHVLPIHPLAVPQRCDSMAGNIVLIKSDAALRVGNLDPVFEHAMGDTDYALRAVKLGVELWLAEGIHGTCSHNTMVNTWRDSTLTLRTRLAQLFSRKGVPWRSWLALTRRHAGVLWPVYFVSPYLKVVVQGLLTRFRSRLRPFEP